MLSLNKVLNSSTAKVPRYSLLLDSLNDLRKYARVLALENVITSMELYVPKTFPVCSHLLSYLSSILLPISVMSGL